MIIRIRVPFKTPTINHLYGQRGFRKYLKPEAKELRKKIQDLCVDQTIPEGKLKVIVEIHEDWYTKKGDIKRKDVSNREKFLIDSVFEAIGIDDKFIFSHTMKKIQDKEEFAIITIECLEKQE